MSNQRGKMGTVARRLLLLLAALLAVSSVDAQALDIGGAQIPDVVELASTRLMVNGGGVRSKAFGLFKVYGIALYLRQRATTREQILSLDGPKSIAIVFLRDRSARQFTDELEDGLAEAPAQRDSLRRLLGPLAPIGELKTGTVVRFDWLPETGTRLSIDGRVIGESVAGAAFFATLLDIWLGPHAPQAALTHHLLGDGR